jgi:acyl-CoA synthetase (AMP-forming)/AMP-acid ligase II
VPVALVEARPDRAVSADDLLAHARSSLSGYEVPTEVRFVTSMPRTDSGKVDLAAARALFPKG